ncbi:MAG: O-succinylbenzoic acid--CoA ligase, partial [Flavobacteriales bacterium]
MTYLDLNTVTLNGKEYSKKEILDFKLRVDSHFEKVIEFLQEWFSDSSDIVVQTSGSTGVPKQIYIPKQSFVE